MPVEAFKTYLSTTKLTFSYKAVLILALLEVVDHHGKANKEQLVSAFHHFYLARQQQGLIPEKIRSRHPSPLRKPDEVNDAQVWQILVRNPLDLLDAYITFDDDTIQFKHAIWSQLRAQDFIELHKIAQQRLDDYYANIE